MIWDSQGVDSALDMEQFEQALEARIERRIAYNPRCCISCRSITRAVLRLDLGLTQKQLYTLFREQGYRSLRRFFGVTNSIIEGKGGKVFAETRRSGGYVWSFPQRRRER